MIDRGRHSVLGVRINAVDQGAAVDVVLAAARLNRPLTVSALAVHGLMTGVLDRTHRHRLNELDLLVPDGQPVRWALNRLYRARLPERVYGPELMLDVCRGAAEERLPVYFYGNHGTVLEDLVASLKDRFPDLVVAGAKASRFRALTAVEHEELVDEIQSSGARVLFVGLGCPRQEVFVYEMRRRLSMPMLAVGAAFSFHAGRLAQAPPRLQRWGLEWAFRLVMEPRRLWKRYLLLNPLYTSLLLLQATGIYTIDPENTVPPVLEAYYG